MSAETRLAAVAALATVLTSVSLYPLFTTVEWFWITLGAVLTVFTANEVARRASAPAILVPPIGAAALLAFLTLVFTSGQAYASFVPSPSSLAELGEIAEQGFTDIRQYAAPVPAFTGITLVTAGGIGLVALVVDLMVLRLRRAAVAGLPLLAVFSVTSAIQEEGAGLPAFVLAAVGFCALLMTDARERVGRWGRRVATRGYPRATGSPAERADTNTLAAAGRRIGVTAVAAAVVVPVLLPELTGRTAVSGWLSGLGAGGSGGGAIHSPSPLVSLKRELRMPADRTVLHYETSDASPAYLRLYALDDFNGRTWSMGDLGGRRTRELTERALAKPPGLDKVPAQRVTTRISIDRQVRGLRFLPLPYPPRRVDVRGEWRYNAGTLMVFSDSDVAGGRTYEVTSWDLQPTREDLAATPAAPARILNRYLQLPQDLPQLVRDLALRITKNTDSPYEQAVQLQEWFTEPGRFTYSLQAQPGDASSPLMAFLRERVGYCEQFASAMAVMARALDIPARVAVGYTAGTEQADGSYLVSTHDAHAWPELYFEGVGWLRFEPTPSGGGQPTATTPTYAEPQAPDPAGTGNPGSQPQPTASAEDESLSTVGGGSTPNTRLPDALGAANPGVSPSGGTPGDPAPTGVVGALLALVLVACVPVTARAAIRWRRWSAATDAAGRAHAAWLELHDTARDLGMPWRTSDSPRSAARRLADNASLGSSASEALSRIRMAEERARYARTPAEIALRADSRTVRRALAASVGWPRRLLGAALPMSTMRAPRRLGVWVADSLNWLDTAAPRLRAWVRRRATSS